MSTNTVYEKRAKKWYRKALKEEDDFVKFILLHITFEVLWKVKSRRDIREEIKIKFFNKVDRTFLKELKRKLDNRPHENMRPNGDTRWDGKLQSISDFDSIISFIKRARDNLFHGDKGLDEGRDLFIVESGNKILKPLIGAIIF